MNTENIKLNLIAAVAYFIAGQIGILLAIPPSNVAVVWPAAGIALGAILISGNRVLPGIFIGAFFAQTLIFFGTSSSYNPVLLTIIGVTISIGVVCQAWIGARLLDSIFSQDKALLKQESIIMFCLLAGPLSCTISASMGIASLWAGEVLKPSDLLLSWCTWWVGDSVGVLAFTPIILCLFGKPRDVWNHRVISVAIPLSILIALAFLVFKVTFQQEIRKMEDEFERNTLHFVHELKNDINFHIDASSALKEFFDSSSEVSELEFKSFVRPKLVRHPEIQALEWIPKIEHSQRESFEETIGIKIRGIDENKKLTTVRPRDYYFPIQYVEPYKTNENAFGFDISSNPKALEAATVACNTGTVSVTEAITTVQETDRKISLVFYAPVYKKTSPINDGNRCEKLLGFTASVFRLENEIERIHKRFENLNLHVALKNNSDYFYDEEPPENKKKRISNKLNFERRYDFPVANQKWELIFIPSSEFITQYYSWIMWLFILGGFLIAVISGIGLMILTGHTLQTEDKIKQRTKELNSEIAERKHTARILSLENKHLEMITEDYSMQDILDSITKGVEDMVEGSICSILFLDISGKYLKHASAPNLPDEYNAIIDGLEIGDSHGSCGTAAFLNKQVIVSDIESDPLWDNYRDLARKYGLRACWSTPITVSNDKVLGTFALYFSEPKEANPKIIDSINRFANIVAITILRKQSEEQLNYHAKHDALTGLVNRREFEQRATRLLSNTDGLDDEHALCFMDLDQFKIINDTCGHNAGDEMLRQLTSVLQSVVRKQDTLARLGGDEFGVLMERCSLDDANRVATSLKSAIQDYQFVWEEHTFKVGVSIGLVAITDTTLDLTQLLRDADAACYMAKELGRNRIHIYHPEDEDLVKRSGEIQWVARLGEALEENRFCLYAQLIQSLDNSSNSHYELLLRMIDENGDVIPPGAFLPAAERYDLIEKLDHWVVKNTFALLSQNPVFLEKINFCSINLSGNSLTSKEILEFIISQLRETGIDNTKICFEITETAAISNLSMAIKFISTLRELGCKFALDDFGSGLSSFGYLKNLSVDFLKIDGMFVRDIVDDPIDHAMVKSINEIGHVMGMKTIAEFVENDVIKGMLKEIGVDYGQGYGIEPPRPLIDLLD